MAPIEKVAFNPVKDAELCSVSTDGTVKFWDVRTKTCVNEVRDLGEAFTLAWAPDGATLIVGNKVSVGFCSSYLRDSLTLPSSPRPIRAYTHTT